MTEHFDGWSGVRILVKLPSMVTKLEILDGRLFANTISHGRFEISVDGVLTPVASAATNKGIH